MLTKKSCTAAQKHLPCEKRDGELVIVQLQKVWRRAARWVHYSMLGHRTYPFQGRTDGVMVLLQFSVHTSELKQLPVLPICSNKSKRSIKTTGKYCDLIDVQNTLAVVESLRTVHRCCRDILFSANVNVHDR